MNTEPTQADTSVADQKLISITIVDLNGREIKLKMV